mgnify:CR=1 FL=1
MLIVGALVALVSISGFNPDAIVTSLASADNGFLNVMNFIFPHIPLMMDSISSESVYQLLLYLLANVIFVESSFSLRQKCISKVCRTSIPQNPNAVKALQVRLLKNQPKKEFLQVI